VADLNIPEILSIKVLLGMPHLKEPQFRALIQSGYLATLPEAKPLKLEKKRVAT